MNKSLRRRIYMWLAEKRGISCTRFAPHGVEITIPAGVDDNIRYQLARGRSYEVPEGRFIKEYLDSGMQVLELGGSLGVISALIRSVIGPDAKHIIVEANDALVDVCRSNATQGAAAGKTEIIVAAIDYSGNPTVTFSTGTGAHVGAVSDDPGGMTVPTTQLSKAAKGLDANSFALVCDIEGMEKDLFNQETALLARVCVLILETHPHAYDDGSKTVEKIINTCEHAGLVLQGREDDVLCFTRAD